MGSYTGDDYRASQPEPSRPARASLSRHGSSRAGPIDEQVALREVNARGDEQTFCPPSPHAPRYSVIAADFLRRIDHGVKVARVIDGARQRHVISDPGELLDCADRD